MKRMLHIAEASGLTVLEEMQSEAYALQNLGASLGGVATAADIPNITIELGGSRAIDRDSVEAGFLALKNILVDMGIVSGSIAPITSSVVIREKGYRREDVWAEKGGVIEYVVRVGDKLKNGAVLARIRNVYGEVVEEVKMPKDGYFVSENTSNASQTGGSVATIAVKVNK